MRMVFPFTREEKCSTTEIPVLDLGNANMIAENLRRSKVVKYLTILEILCNSMLRLRSKMMI